MVFAPAVKAKKNAASPAKQGRGAVELSRGSGVGNQAMLRFFEERRRSLNPILASCGQALPSTTRAALGARFNFDFSSLRIHTGQQVERNAAVLGVPAYTWGSNIALTSNAATHEHILMHELVHVVQQQTGQTAGLATSNSTAERARLEQQAEVFSRRVLAGSQLPSMARPTQPTPVLQGFDPNYHEESVIAGAAGSFTPEEIGKIYEANWRRDFSQASPALADIALIWKQLNDAPASPAGFPMLQAKLAGAILAVVLHPWRAGGETYGGYQSFEHMDNPGDDEANARWAGSAEGIAGYIADSRAYIKQKLAQAVRLARAGWNPPDDVYAKRVTDAWSNGKPLVSYDSNAIAPPPEIDKPKSVKDPSESSAVVAADVAAIAYKDPQATLTPTRGFGTDPAIADDLGRASHALEDFFAHSNFVELARPSAPGTAITATDLRTGTFGLGDKAGALADKINTIVTSIKAHRQLIPSVILPDSVLAKFANVARTADILASVTTGPPTGSIKATSHFALNKDEPTRPNFDLALRLSTEADRRVFESIHRAMEASLPDVSSQIVYDTYALIDALINIPSDTHPLKSFYE